MKTKIEIKVLEEGCMPVINPKGDWIDLYAAKDIDLRAPQAGREHQVDLKKQRDVKSDVTYVPLGIAMKLPKGFEAWVVARSSAPKKVKIMIANSKGIIDNCYNGNEDQWMAPVVAIDNTVIHKGDRICQFRIALSQFAGVGAKFKWLFSNGIKLVEVDNLEDVGRGGFGTSGL